MKTTYAVRMVLATLAMSTPLLAAAKFTVIEQTGRLEVQPGTVESLAPGTLTELSDYYDFQAEGDFQQEVAALSFFNPDKVSIQTFAYIPALPNEPVGLMKVDFMLTFDVSDQAKVVLTIRDQQAQSSFQHLLDDGTAEAIALPEQDGFGFGMRTLILAAGRYQIASHLVYDASNTPPDWNGFQRAYGQIGVAAVPEPGVWALAVTGLLVLGRTRNRRI